MATGCSNSSATAAADGGADVAVTDAPQPARDATAETSFEAGPQTGGVCNASAGSCECCATGALGSPGTCVAPGTCGGMVLQCGGGDWSCDYCCASASGTACEDGGCPVGANRLCAVEYPCPSGYECSLLPNPTFGEGICVPSDGGARDAGSD